MNGVTIFQGNTSLYTVIPQPRMVFLDESEVRTVHIRWERCTARESFNYEGKEGFPTFSHEVTVEHTSKIFASHTWISWNEE